jgi:beta-glucanase (GH16 family)
MKIKLKYLIAICSLFFLLNLSKGQCYELVWSDEFDIEGLPDSARWSYDVGGGGWGNNELQYYTYKRLENARIENGKLIIEARKESYLGSNYTSARLVSKYKGDWLYGNVEVRAKLPGGIGTWAAIWMLPTDWFYGSWPKSGEIDIMEHVGYDEGNIHGTIHTEAYNHTLGTQKGGSMMVSDALDTFHVYKAKWTPEKIEIYVDDTKYFTFNNEHTGYTTWPFDKRFHLLLNLAVGGAWGGAQGVDPAAFPARMEIDYVRIYQPSENLVIQGPDKAYPLQENLHFFLYRDEGASYAWSISGDGEILTPADSNEVYIRWNCDADTVLCHVTTQCGEYNLKFPVKLDDYNIVAPFFIEQQQDSILLTAPALQGTTYNWLVPDGVTILGDANNDSLYVKWGNESGIVTLNMDNTCGLFEVIKKMRLFGQYAYPDPDSPHLIPGTFNATEYDYGGEGIAYHDAEVDNQGAGPRQDEGVDTEFSDNGGANVGWIIAGEWLEYTIRVKEDDIYQVGIRAASNTSPRGPLRIRINGESRIPDITIPSTGSWSSFTTIVVSGLPLYTTDTLIQLYATGGGFNLGNITIDTFVASAYKSYVTNTLLVYPNPASNFMNIASEQPVSKIDVTDISGIIIYSLIPEKNSTVVTIDLSNYKPGIYLIYIHTEDQRKQVVKIVHQ